MRSVRDLFSHDECSRSESAVTNLAPPAGLFALGLLVPLGLLACEKGAATGDAVPTSSLTATNSTAPTSQASDVSLDRPSIPSDTEPLFNGKPPELQVADASDEIPDVSDAPLVVCTPATGSGETLLIDDFEDGDTDIVAEKGLAGAWYIYEESQGDHEFEVERLASPRLDSQWAVHTSASDQGGWAGLGASLSSCVYDASGYVGVHFWIRGTSGPIEVALLTPGVIPFEEGGTCTQNAEGLCWDAYRSTVAVSEGWTEVFLPFTTFEQLGYGQDAGPLDLTRLVSIQFQSDPSPFDLWIDDLSLYTEEIYTPLDAGVDSAEQNDTGAGVGDAAPTHSSTPTSSEAPSTATVSSNDGGVQ